MKIFVEQIIISQGILVYSNYCKFTDSDDEEGSDFEYDFESVYANIDGIQNSILRLYGTQGLISVFSYFAEGKDDVLSFEPIEFEESSPLREMISKISQNVNPKDRMSDNYDKEIPNINVNQSISQPTDTIFLLNGLLAGLPHNEDLNVMRMLGQPVATVPEDVKQKCLDVARNFGIMNDAALFPFSFDQIQKIVVVGKHSFIGVIVDEDNIILDFPSNEMQEKTHSLFNKYIEILNVTKLKKSIILETKFNALANMETKESLRDYLLLFNVETAKFESKENRLTI